jgi:hypothetical protein
MGQSSQSTTTSNSSQPWNAAMPEVNGLLGQLGSLIPNSGLNSAQSGAISQLTANGQAGDPYAASVGNVATNLLNGGGATSEVPAVQQNYNAYASSLSPYTSSNYSTLNSPAVQSALNQIATDTSDSVNSQFAAAGRSGSGMNQQTLARGIAQAEAPLLLNQANQDTQTSLGAINSLYGAGNTTANTVAGMNQQGVTNQQAGVGASNDALNAQNWGPQQILAAQQLAQQIPAQNLGLLAQIGIPLAGLGSTSNGTSNTTTDPSLLSDLGSLGGLFSSAKGGASAAAGMGQAAAGVGSGILGLLGMI